MSDEQMSAVVREITVISGKGGTGKTSLAASLAILAGKAVVADCDVDAADLHLILTPHVRERQRFVSGNLAVIESGRCTGCGLCLGHCRYGAIERDEGGASGCRPRAARAAASASGFARPGP